MRRALVAAVVAALALSGCANGDGDATDQTDQSAASATASPGASDPADDGGSTPAETGDEGDDDALTVEIEIEGDSIQPNGQRVKVGVGETVVLDVESDRAARLHVHSVPEQVLDVEKGESRLELVVETPGVVDVEEHDTGIVILQLEVR